VPNRRPNLNSSSWQATKEQALPRIAHFACSAMRAVSTLALIGMAVSPEARADVFGQCAHQRNLEEKIAACVQATKLTPYPWILQWVHRELARSQRERGQIQEAIVSFERSLAAEERAEVRRVLEEVTSSAPQGEKLQMGAAGGRQR
jgi:hypothetical protein